MMTRRSIRLALVAVLVSVACAPDAADDAARDVNPVAKPDVVQGLYFVGWKQNPGVTHRALVASHGGQVRHEFPEVRAFAVSIGENGLASLARDGRVEYFEPVPMRYRNAPPSGEVVPALDNGLYGLVKIGATAVQASGVRGAGVRVGVADEGLDCDHPDIAAKHVESRDFVSYAPRDPCDPDPSVGENHGTHVSGTIVGVDNNVGVIGVAPAAELYHARVLGPEGGFTSEIMAGVRWLVVDKGVRIVNLSLGGGRPSRTEESFYKEMRARGAIVFAAAGNESARKLGYPAGYAVNVSVGATDVNDALASFSNVGRGLDLVAPGVDVLSSVAEGQGYDSKVVAGGTTYKAFAMEFAGTTSASGLSGTLVSCGLSGPGECPASVSGNIALIQRGTFTFAEKVQNAMDAGASAAIIYNNQPGDFAGTLGGAGSWIPAVSVSDATGAALLGQSSATVVNQVSSWDYFSGTSMATPHAAGAAALIWSSNAALSADDVETTLKSSCDDLGAPGYDTTFGNGRINVDRAIP